MSIPTKIVISHPQLFNLFMKAFNILSLRSGAYGGSEVGAIVGGMVGPPVIGGIVGGIVGEVVGKDAVANAGLDEKAKKVCVNVSVSL